jgi:hypothetical protein
VVKPDGPWLIRPICDHHAPARRHPHDPPSFRFPPHAAGRGRRRAGRRRLAVRRHAQSGTVRFILPNATGSGVDAITRAASPALGKALNASVVVDNQPGAGGVVGLQALARSAPDGNTLSWCRTTW